MNLPDTIHQTQFMERRTQTSEACTLIRFSIQMGTFRDTLRELRRKRPPCTVVQNGKGIVSEGCITKHVDHTTYVWVVKIWFEDSVSPDAQPFWRGHVKDVLTNHELYFQSLDDLKAFIAQEIAK